MASSDAVPDPASADSSVAHRLEQEHLDRVYARLDDLREHTRTRLGAVRRTGATGSHQNRSERDAFATLYEDRLAQLNAVEERLVFGRLDLAGDERRYVGRLGLSDAEHVPMLTDWRAPAARAFYQATAAHPGDVVLRRHLQTKDRQVVGIEDDVLDLDAVADTDVVLSGEGALLSALNAQRTGRMGDIVATIQAEQDAVIRSGLDGVLIVEGGPGTGKTAVALHRAAYLLYAHRQRIERSGVLLIGPSRVFLRYIEKVLPSLGETGVVAITMADLVPGIDATGTESDEVAEIKGRREWSSIIAAAVRARQRVLPERDLVVGSVRLRLLEDDVRRAQERARRTRSPHNVARVTFVRHMLSSLAAQYSEKVPGVGEDDRADIIEELRGSRDVRIALNLCWMPLSATGLLEDLYAKPHRLAEAAPRLSARDRRLLERGRGEPWTPADVLLVDEAAERIGEDDEAERSRSQADQSRREADVEYAREMLEQSGAGDGLIDAQTVAERFSSSGPELTTAERALADRRWTYGHVVIDEAQELSPMAWHALLRRNPTRSMTIVGDVSQTSSRSGARSWSQMLERPLRGRYRTSTLTVNYRTPASVMAAARAMMTAADPDHPPTPVTSAREVPDAVAVSRAEDLLTTLADVVSQERARLDGGRLAVIVPTGLRSAVVDALGGHGRIDLTQEVVVLDPTASKGLEFDVVVLAEPARILAEAGRPGDLYVAMTRPTRRLHMVHTEPLPAGLEASST
ncbi:AAA family ATPase [Ruania suaedae]|uniref:HelD family protein n=1 Tax=Ruania suaedae TaxID=2897774 RepID=UPI001E4F0681|nr:UvrD-helicase domain-containing protein [Ruania suaedae]UFU04213.1 AAA family ATPase [Ruania suaedae]